MIETNRLEELIKQGATVYCADRDVQFPIPIFLNEEDFVKKEDLSHEKSCVRDNIPLEDLYETEKQAEWALKYQRIPRTEYLDLPTWEEIKDVKNKTIVSFYAAHKYFDIVTIHIFSEYFNVESEDDVLFYTKFTEENYIKACDLCVELFKGE